MEKEEKFKLKITDPKIKEGIRSMVRDYVCETFLEDFPNQKYMLDDYSFDWDRWCMEINGWENSSLTLILKNYELVEKD